jgi:hypothetical protein
MSASGPNPDSRLIYHVTVAHFIPLNSVTSPARKRPRLQLPAAQMRLVAGMYRSPLCVRMTSVKPWWAHRGPLRNQSHEGFTKLIRVLIRVLF